MQLFRKRDTILLPIAGVMMLVMLLVPDAVRSAVDGVLDIVSDTGPQSSYDAYRKLGPQVGQEAPEIEGTTLDGDLVRLSDFRGKVVYLNFWADG